MAASATLSVPTNHDCALPRCAQAAEGKLGRAYEYHRAPAPFVQLELLRLLALLGRGDKGASENMYAVVAEVKRRAEPLGNNIGAHAGRGRQLGRPGRLRRRRLKVCPHSAPAALCSAPL